MLYVLYLYRCIGCMEVFSSKENAQRHERRCKSAGYVAMTLDEFLHGKKPRD